MSQSYYFGATTFAVPICGSGVFPVLITPPPMAVGGELRRISGGSLEIMPNVISGGSIGGATVPGVGYLIGGSQILSWDGPAAFYLAATGATAVVGAYFRLNAGATLI